MGQHHRQGQKFRRFLAGITVHDTLIPRAELPAAVDGTGDIRALRMGDDLHLVVGAAVSGLPHRLAEDCRNVREPAGRDLTGGNDLTGSRHHLAGHVSRAVQCQAGVQHSVRNGVAELVGMPLRDGLRH